MVLQGDVLAPARVVSAGGISLEAGVSSVAPGQSWSAVGDVSVAPGAALVLRGSEVSLGGVLRLSRSLSVGEGSVLRVGSRISGDVSVARGGCLAVGGADGPLVSLSVGSLVMEPGSSLRLSLDAVSGRADSIVASRGVAFNGARLVLEGVDAVSAASVKDGLRVRVTDSDVLTPPDVSAVCVGSWLNAYTVEDGHSVDVVLSRNFRSAAVSPDEVAVARALAVLDDGHVQDAGLSAVLDALAHTRSAADARAALNVLGGAGLSGMRLLVAEGGREHVGALRDVLRGRAGEGGRRGLGIGVSMTGGGTFDFSPSGGAFSSDSLGWLLGLVLPLGDGWAVGASAGVCGYDAGYLGVDFEGGAFFADAALLYDAGRLHQVLSLGVGSFGVDTRRDVAVRAHGYDVEGVLRGRMSALSLNMGYEGSYDVLVSSDGLSRLSPVLLADVVLGRFDEMSESGLGRAGLRSRCDDVCYVTLGTGLRYVHGFGASGGLCGLGGFAAGVDGGCVAVGSQWLFGRGAADGVDGAAGRGCGAARRGEFACAAVGSLVAAGECGG